MNDEREKDTGLSETPEAGQAQAAGDDGKRLLIMRVPIMEIKPGYVLRKVGQAFMVMPTGPRMKDYEGMITLNETGAFLFEEMQKPDPTTEKLEQACIQKYGATNEEAQEAVKSFLAQCGQCGLIDYEEKIFLPDGREITREDLSKPADEVLGQAE